MPFRTISLIQALKTRKFIILQKFYKSSVAFFTSLEKVVGYLIAVRNKNRKDGGCYVTGKRKEFF